MMEQSLGAKSLNPFDDDLLDLSVEEGEDTEKYLSPLNQLEQCWSEIDNLSTSNTMDPFAMEELRVQLSNIEKLLIKDSPESHGQTGPCLQYLLSENIMENIYMLSTRFKPYAKEIRILLLKFSTEIFTRSSQPILIHQQILRPISKLLRACEGTNDREMTTSLIPLLHTMCILMQENQSLLDLFFIDSHVHMQSRFLVFTQLIPHMHESGDVGNRARDALLLCLSLADQLSGSSLTHFIASDCNFCQVLATGLSAHYSRLPSTRDLVVDEWQSPLPVIKTAVPELQTFIQALDFCNSVLQMAPKLVCNTMLTLVREGFLHQVMGPALLQDSQSAVMFSTAYFAIFLTHISNVALMKEFLCYLMQGQCDNRLVINALIQNISSTNHLLSSVTLELFYVLLDLNCEDVMLELILKYLLPGHHVMPNQLAIIGSPDLYAQAARKFLQLMPASCIAAEKMLLNSIRKSMTPTPELSSEEVVPPPSQFTTSPHLSGNHLEQPIPVRSNNGTPKLPLTNLPVIPPPRSTNPFDDPLPTTQSLSRSRSNSDASTSSLVSMSSVSSTPQAGVDLVKAKPINLSKTSSVTATAVSSSFKFEYISPEMAYYDNLITAREAIKKCINRCSCWSSIYDRCQVSKEMILEENRKIKKSLEMEDITSVKVHITSEETSSVGIVEGDNLHFRSRATTLTANSRLQHHNQLHSNRSLMATEEDRMVAGVSSSEHAQNDRESLIPNKGFRRSGTVSGDRNRPRRRMGSPRLSPVQNHRRLLPISQFEDYTGLFLKVVMEKLVEMMQHPPIVNILLTQLISRLTHYPQPLIRSLLLNHQLVLKPGVPNLFSVLQNLKQTIDKYARTQEDFERRLGRARKTMIYRAQIRNSQSQQSITQQKVTRQLLSQQSLRTNLDGSVVASSSPGPSHLVKTNSKTNMSSSVSKESFQVQENGARSHRKKKKVSTDTLFGVVIFYEFLRELASISEEQSVMHSLLYLPNSTSLLNQ